MPTASHPTADHLARWAIAVLAVTLWLASPPQCEAAKQAAPQAAIAHADPMAALPPQGLYEGCAPGATPESCIEHLATIRAAGFRYVLNYSAWYGSAAEVMRYADTAAALGLRLIWPLNHPAWRGLVPLATTYPHLSGDDANESNQDFIARTIPQVAAHPATWGFYIGDELPVVEVTRAEGLSQAVRQIAPDEPQLYVARPGAALLASFAPLADVAGVDTYPIGSGDPSVGSAARAAREVASAAGAQTAMVLQAFSWSQYRPVADPPSYPSARMLRAMRDAAIRQADPAMILWYSYQDILRSDRPQRRWRDLSRAAFSPFDTRR
jgi:hypothetical protein